MKYGVIVTGLPASGKTTIARGLTEGLGFTFLDKDDFLEKLFEDNEVLTLEDRQHLSRRSDETFRIAATKARSAVLVSHWRPVDKFTESGTPTNWLEDEYDCLVEVCCVCSPQNAYRRFTGRSRHPGHMDDQRNKADVLEWLTSWSANFPLGIGTLMEVETDGSVNMQKLVEKVGEALGMQLSKE